MRIKASYLVAALLVVSPASFAGTAAQATGQLRATDYAQTKGAARAGSGCDTAGLLAVNASGHGTVVCDATTQQWIVEGDSPEGTMAFMQAKFGEPSERAEAFQQYTVTIYHGDKLMETTTLSLSPEMPAYASVGGTRSYSAQCVKTSLAGVADIKLTPALLTTGLVVYGAIDMHAPLHPLRIMASLTDLRSMKTVEGGDGCVIETPELDVDNAEFPPVELKPGAHVDVTNGHFRAELTRNY